MGTQKSNKYRPLSRQLVLVLFGFSVFITTAFTFAQFFLDWKREDSVFTRESLKVLNVAAVSISEPLWNRNPAGLNSQIDALFQHLEVQSVRIFNENQKLEMERTKDSKQIADLTKLRSKVILDGAGEIGFLEIDFTDAEVIGRLKTRLETLILLNMLKAFLVSFMIYYFVQKRIGIPINGLANYFRIHPKASSLVHGDPAFQRDGALRDEITELMDYIAEREMQLASFIESQEEKIGSQVLKLSESEMIIIQERSRAEASARLAQLGEMATGIAHEINNPLAVISGQSYRLRQKKDGTMPSEAIILEISASIESMVKRISGIIRGLKTYARDGRGDPFAPVAADVILNDVKTMVVGRLITKNIEMKITNDMSPDTVFECREVQLSQVLVILSNNALDAIKEQENPWIELHALDDANFVTFRVTDSGLGIPKEIQDKLFSAYFTTKPVGQGTGLGLSLAMEMIRSHNGEIFIDNSVKNTCFVVRIPKKAPPTLGDPSLRSA